jgi:hypothetical protein
LLEFLAQVPVKLPQSVAFFGAMLEFHVGMKVKLRFLNEGDREAKFGTAKLLFDMKALLAGEFNTELNPGTVELYVVALAGKTKLTAKSPNKNIDRIKRLATPNFIRLFLLTANSNKIHFTFLGR